MWDGFAFPHCVWEEQAALENTHAYRVSLRLFPSLNLPGGDASRCVPRRLSGGVGNTNASTPPGAAFAGAGAGLSRPLGSLPYCMNKQPKSSLGPLNRSE